MLDLFLYILAGLGVGILTGLLPALPTFTASLVLYQISGGMTFEQILVFWFTAYIGSQFFGSVATITTNIPGEESSLIYLNDLPSFSLREKNELLYSTALSSFIASIIGIVLFWLIVSHANLLQYIPWIFSVKTKLAIYGLMIAAFVITAKKKWWTVLTVLFGLSIAPKDNFALPNLWYDWQWLFSGYTFYLIILGTIVIPNVVGNTFKVQDTGEKFHAEKAVHFRWWETIKASLVGFAAGLVPGPSASLGSIAAYKTMGGTDKKRKIVAAEAANNSAILAATILFVLLNLPLNNTVIIMSSILDIKGISIGDALTTTSAYISSMTVLDFALLVSVVVTVLYYILSTRLINWYVGLIRLVHRRINLVLIAIVTGLIYLDIQDAEITLLHYLILLAVFTAIGFFLKKKEVSAIPMMFTILLGGKFIWAFMQVLSIS